MTVAAPNGPSQVMAHKILDQMWGHWGFMLWLVHLVLEYRQSRDALIRDLELHIPASVCAWNVPDTGMFL